MKLNLNMFENCHFVMFSEHNLPNYMSTNALEITDLTLRGALKFYQYIHLKKPMIQGVLIDKNSEKIFLLTDSEYLKMVESELKNLKNMDCKLYTYQHLLPFEWKEVYYF